MQLTLDNIKSAGGFVGGPVKKQIKWEVGDKEFTADVYVRRLSYHTAVTDAQSLRSGADFLAARIAQSICHEDGSPVFRVCDITGLNDDGTPVTIKDEKGKDVERGPICKSLSDALLVAINEANSLGKRK